MFLKTVSLALIVIVARGVNAADPDRPNIVFILTDDQRYDELGFMNPVLETLGDYRWTDEQRRRFFAGLAERRIPVFSIHGHRDVQLGAHVRFKARSHPKRVFEGEVVSIAPSCSERNPTPRSRRSVVTPT